MKEFLSHRRVPFETRWLTDPANRREVAARGTGAPPLTLIDDEACWGFDRAGLTAALERKGFATAPAATAPAAHAGMFGAPIRNAVAVTSFLGDALTFLERGSFRYVGGTLEGSTLRIPGHPIAAEVCEREGSLAAVNYEGGSVTFLSLAGGYLRGTLERSTLATGEMPLCAVAHPLVPRLYVSNSESRSLTVFDSATGGYAFGSHARSSFAVPGQPGTLAIHAVEDLLYVRLREGTVVVLHASSMQPAWGSIAQSTFPVGRGRGIALSHDQRFLHVPEAEAIGDRDGFAVYEASSGKRVTESLPAAATPFAVAAHPREAIVYVSCFGARLIEFRDAATGRYLRGSPENSSVAVGNGARAMLVDPVDDTLYVSCYDEDAVYLFDAVSGAPRSKIALGRGPRGLALLPA